MVDLAAGAAVSPEVHHQRMLRDLGVGAETLSASQRSAVDRDGYVVIPGAIATPWLDELRDRVVALAAEEGPAAGSEHDQEAGATRLANLADKGPVFDGIYRCPAVLAVAAHVIGGPFRVYSLNARTAQQGQGHQALHADWAPRAAGEGFHIVNSLWLLDDVDAGNGPTRIVPGSHRLAGSVRDHVSDPGAAHPDQRLLEAPRGTVVVFNAHTWHGGTTNLSGRSRWVLHVSYAERHYPQQTDQRRWVGAASRDRIDAAGRYLLDI